jgi:hypothetical protein
VYDRIESSPLLIVTKDDSTELGTIERSVLFQNIRAKCGYDLVKGPSARTDDVSSEDIGVDNRDPPGGQLPRNCRLPCCDTACKTYDYSVCSHHI